MKINILYKFESGPWGGGNQFLKALRNKIIANGNYTESSQKANVIIFNGYPFGSEYLFSKALRIKMNFPEKIFIYRLDGPLHLYRGKDKLVDKIIKNFNGLFIDGIIFQSNWSRLKNKNIFSISANYEILVYNASDENIFNKKNRKTFRPDKKTKLIATSWSSNWNKGFDIYHYLDKFLDFTKYSMTFIGNSPISFKNIKHIKALPSLKLSKELKQHDIYITASRQDPCSNSLIEALACGLPALVRNEGGHPELIKQGGETFNNKDDILKKIDTIKNDYYTYARKIPQLSMDNAAQKYMEFAERIFNDTKKSKYVPKKINYPKLIKYLFMKVQIFQWKLFKELKIN